MQQAELHIPDESRMIAVDKISYPCPGCGFHSARIHRDFLSGKGMRYRIMCIYHFCKFTTDWMDSSQKALQVWKVQSILSRK